MSELISILDKLFKPAHERLRSPLLSSFAISWLIINSYIFFIIFLPSYSLPDGVSTLEYIDRQTNWFTGLVGPLAFSLFYVFLYPIIELKWILPAFEENRRKQIDKKLEIGKKHKVDGVKYYDLWQNVEKLKADLENANEDNIALKNKVAELEQNQDVATKNSDELAKQLRNTTQELQHLQTQINRRHELHTYFRGVWRLTYKSGATEKSNEDLYISDTKYYIKDVVGDRYAFDIDLFEFREDVKEVSFIKIDPTDRKRYVINKLRVLREDIWEGTEYDNAGNVIPVRYERIEYTPQNKTSKDISKKVEKTATIMSQNEGQAVKTYNIDDVSPNETVTRRKSSRKSI